MHCSAFFGLCAAFLLLGAHTLPAAAASGATEDAGAGDQQLDAAIEKRRFARISKRFPSDSDDQQDADVEKRRFARISKRLSDDSDDNSDEEIEKRRFARISKRLSDAHHHHLAEKRRFARISKRHSHEVFELRPLESATHDPHCECPPVAASAPQSVVCRCSH